MGKLEKKHIIKSQIIESLLKESKKELYESAKSKMQLAIRIKERMVKLGMSNTDLANKLDKNKSEITKWLSGTHNFTVDRLVEIGNVLGIKLLNVKEEPELIETEYKITVNVMAGEKRRTYSPLASNSTINGIPVKEGRC